MTEEQIEKLQPGDKIEWDHPDGSIGSIVFEKRVTVNKHGTYASVYFYYFQCWCPGFSLPGTLGVPYAHLLKPAFQLRVIDCERLEL